MSASGTSDPSSKQSLPQTTIPQIPLAHFAHGPTPSSVTRPELLKSLRSALLSTGFLSLTHLDHHLPPDLTQRLINILPRIFKELSSEQKDTAALVNTPHFLGYSSFGTEITAGGRDWREQYEFAGVRGPDSNASLANGSDVNGDDAQPLHLRLRGPNQYPDFEGREEMRSVIEEYIAAVQKIAAEFLALADEALSLENGVLEQFAQNGQDRMKLVHYDNGQANGSNTEPNTNGSSPSKPSSIPTGFIQGVGPHKDSSGWLTFLLQASPDTRGLQALSKDGIWLDVPPLEGSLVVNMGQAFEAATNGVCKATTHRVLLAPGSGSRYSVPFFMGVRPSLTKEELKGLWQHFEPERWETRESEEGVLVDSPFLRGEGYKCWGDAQLRTKIRSHRDVGKRWYADVYEKYVEQA